MDMKVRFELCLCASHMMCVQLFYLKKIKLKQFFDADASEPFGRFLPPSDDQVAHTVLGDHLATVVGVDSISATRHVRDGIVFGCGIGEGVGDFDIV